MPTITFSYRDFQQLLGKKLPFENFEKLLLLYAKAEVEKYEKQLDEVTVKLDDTNLPYLWCPEGLARLFMGILGMRQGAAKLKLNSSSYRIIAEGSVKKVRPFITAFVAKGNGKKLDDYLLKQLVQAQEKLDSSYGMRRQKLSIGLYSYRRITFPVHYKAVAPESVKFAPLGFEKELNLKEILAQHPKGMEYGWIIKGFPKYPLLIDDKGEVLSLPPIINSNFTGKLEIGDAELLFEATGTDEEAINLAANVFAQNLSERGFAIYSVAISHGNKTTASPASKTEKVKVSLADVEQLVGLKLREAELKQLLQKAGYDIEGSHGGYGAYAIVPHYRADIMHCVDIVEDVAIAYGYDKIAGEPLRSYTTGMPVDSAPAINLLRKTVIGMGFQEVFGHILIDKNTLQGEKVIELQNFMSETYSAVRNSVLPQLLDVLARNKHVDYPQKIFEEGIVAAKEGSGISEWHSLALTAAHSKADFTEMKQYLTALFTAAASKFEIQPTEHPAFMKGRAGSIVVKKTQIGSSRLGPVAGKTQFRQMRNAQSGEARFATWESVGIIGEISPAVLSKFGIETPAAAIEINLNLLLGLS